MAKLVFGTNQSLDGYVDHERFGPLPPGLFRHYIDHVRGLRGMLSLLQMAALQAQRARETLVQAPQRLAWGKLGR